MKIIKKEGMWILLTYYKKTKQHRKTIIRSNNWQEKRKGKAKNNVDGQYQGLVKLKL